MRPAKARVPAPSVYVLLNMNRTQWAFVVLMPILAITGWIVPVVLGGALLVIIVMLIGITVEAIKMMGDQ